MAITATFVPDQIEVLPNVSASLTLRLHNDDSVTRVVTLAASGDLRDHARLDGSTATLEADQIVEVPMTVFVPATVAAGTHMLAAEVGVAPIPADLAPPDQAMADLAAVDQAIADQARADRPPEAPPTGQATPVAADASVAVGANVVVATATVEVTPHSDYTIALQPVVSRGSSGGRHVVRVANTGNVEVDLAVSAELVGDGITVEPPSATLVVPPGLARETSLRVTPDVRFWSGPVREHHLTLRATAADGRSDELVGTFRQRPRVPNWVGPAAAGAFIALLVGAIAWFALLRPWVEDTADRAAADAIEQDRAALRERIAELEAAAAEAAELPLGSPTDIRLDVAPAGGNTETASFVVDPGTVVSITDVVFQNPTGAVGTMSLRRGDEVILRSELANFRDFDLHFVAPYVFDDGAEIVFEVECRTPGTDASTCPVGVSLVGFVD